jgi:Alkylmercury lyase
MDPVGLEIRRATYRRFVELGRAPTVDEVATESGIDAAAVQTAWQRLHDQHALVVDSIGQLRMANPFSAVETAFRVDADGRSWYANCAWDAFGIGAALHVDSTITTTCPDCSDPITIRVRGGRPDDEHLVFHVLVPAVSWWQDIGFT